MFPLKTAVIVKLPGVVNVCVVLSGVFPVAICVVLRRSLTFDVVLVRFALMLIVWPCPMVMFAGVPLRESTIDVVVGRMVNVVVLLVLVFPAESFAVQLKVWFPAARSRMETL